MALPLDPDDDLQAAGYRAAGPQIAQCGHHLQRGDILVELTTTSSGGISSMCTRCFAAVGHRVAVRTGIWADSNA